MVVTKVHKVVKMERKSIVRFQIMTYCELNKIELQAPEIECITLLALAGKVSLSNFCNDVSDKGMFRWPQAVRNLLNKMEKLKLVVKHGEGKKMVEINPEMEIETSENTILNLKLFSIESKES